MKKNALVLLAGIALVFGMISCGGGAGKSPSDTVLKFYDAYADKDYEKVVSYMVKKDGSELTDEEKSKLMLMFPEGAKEFEKEGGLKEVKITKEEIAEDGKTATVEFDLVFNNGETDGETEKLILVDGKWYMIFKN